MIIDKVKPYWTEEEHQELLNIIIEQNNLIEAVGAEEARTAKDVYIGETKLEEWHTLEKKANSIWREVENRYIKDRKAKGLLEDAKEIIESITKEDYLKYTEVHLDQVAKLQKGGAPADSLVILKELAVESYDNCYNYVLHPVRVQLNGLAETPDGTDKVIAMVEKQVAKWYVKPQPAYFPMAHGKATDALAFMSTKNADVDRITGTATINKFGVQLAIIKLEELRTTLGISTDKLLSTAIATFTQQNDFRHLKGKTPNREVAIPLREYAQLLGYDITKKTQIDNARKAIKKDLDLIHASTLTWTEPIKGSSSDFERVSLVTYTGIKNGLIKIAFSPEIANYLAERNLITQYPTKLLGISGRQPNAYYIGRKLAEHYNLDNNQIRGTHDRIGIPALLAVTDLPSYEEVQATDRGHWERRIKEPLEENLDILVKEGILKEWKYTHAKGIELTEEEAYNITSYDSFSKLYLRFNPADKVSHEERIETKRAKREEHRKKRKSRKKS